MEEKINHLDALLVAGTILLSVIIGSVAIFIRPKEWKDIGKDIYAHMNKKITD
jgi:hypothetical protein